MLRGKFISRLKSAASSKYGDNAQGNPSVCDRERAKYKIGNPRLFYTARYSFSIFTAEAHTKTTHCNESQLTRMLRMQ